MRNLVSVVAALSLSVWLGGCRLPPDIPDQIGTSCELKNPTGSGTCDDGEASAGGRAGNAEAQSAAPAPESDTEYFEAVEYVEPPSYEEPVAVDDGDRSGTWECKNSLSGGSSYGTWEMTQHPEYLYDCRRV